MLSLYSHCNLHDQDSSNVICYARASFLKLGIKFFDHLGHKDHFRDVQFILILGFFYLDTKHIVCCPYLATKFSGEVIALERSFQQSIKLDLHLSFSPDEAVRRINLKLMHLYVIKCGSQVTSLEKM